MGILYGDVYTATKNCKSMEDYSDMLMEMSKLFSEIIRAREVHFTKCKEIKFGPEKGEMTEYIKIAMKDFDNNEWE